MSRIDAPLFNHCDALSRGLLRRVRAWPPSAARLLGEPIVAAGLRLHCAVAVALVFPDRRVRAVRRADEAAAQLRVLLGLTDEAPALLDAGDRAHLCDELAVIGRMVGGWRKRVRARGVARAQPVT